MIDSQTCSVSLKLISDDQITKALVSFSQDETQFRGFRLKLGPYGLWLEPPKIKTGKGWLSVYHDENKSRWKAVQSLVIEQYEEKCQSANLDDVEETVEPISKEARDVDDILKDLPF